MPSLFCKLYIVRVTLQDSCSSPSGLLLRKSADGWGQSWNLGDVAIYCIVPCFHTCNVKTHTHKHTTWLKKKWRDTTSSNCLIWTLLSTTHASDGSTFSADHSYMGYTVRKLNYVTVWTVILAMFCWLKVVTHEYQGFSSGNGNKTRYTVKPLRR